MGNSYDIGFIIEEAINICHEQNKYDVRFIRKTVRRLLKDSAGCRVNPIVTTVYNEVNL